jgi:hypothetical protein
VSAVQARQGQGVFPPKACSRGEGRFRLACGASIEQRQTAGVAGEKPIAERPSWAGGRAGGIRGLLTPGPSSADT